MRVWYRTIIMSLRGKVVETVGFGGACIPSRARWTI